MRTYEQRVIDQAVGIVSFFGIDFDVGQPEEAPFYIARVDMIGVRFRRSDLTHFLLEDIERLRKGGILVRHGDCTYSAVQLNGEVFWQSYHDYRDRRLTEFSPL